ncbi:MAG: shikimate kinase [Gammaproteobacteria bacterium]|nr:shikimate kinase [Gammaproteobacteria bacterium]
MLIGLPGSGKTTIGKRFARSYNLKFLDTDALIEQRYGYSLQQLMNRHGHKFIRSIEEQALSSLNLQNHVISTGGSAVYSELAMSHLQASSCIVYLQISLATLLRRVNNTSNRGLVMLPHYSLPTLYHERLPLYRRWAQVIIDNNRPLTAWQFDRIAAQILAA